MLEAGTLNTAMLVWALIFSSIGLGFFMYGKKQKTNVAFYTGVALMIFPYAMPNVTAMILIGVFLMCFPYFYKVIVDK